MRWFVANIADRAALDVLLDRLRAELAECRQDKRIAAEAQAFLVGAGPVRAGLPAVRIAVNVSPLQLRDPIFISQIVQTIAVAEDAAQGLELEITESMIMDDVQQSIASLAAIRDMVDEARPSRLLKCDEIQGYLVSPAIAGAEFEARFLATDWRMTKL